MSWSPYVGEDVVDEANEIVVNERVDQIARRMADLAKQMELFESDDFEWFGSYLEAFKERTKAEAITIEDPIKHAEKRAEYRLLAFLIALPHTTSLEYQTLKDELETLRPEESDTLNV